MTKLPILSGLKIIKTLSKAGFEAVRQKGSHVILVKYIGKEKIGTVVPKHKEIRIGTLKGILEQAQLTEKEFLRLLKK